MDRSPVEAIYPLSPLQQGMLFHTLYAPASGTYFEQFTFSFRGELDPEAWERAWERVAARHAVLRTAFAWEKRDKPLQIVARAVRLPWEHLDWRGLPDAERAARMEVWLREDRARGFEMNRAPLMRLALLRTADDAWEFVWSHHHVLLDGWSVGIVLGEVFALYEGLREGREPSLPQPRPFRDYVAWLQGRDAARAEAFWRAELAGFRTATPLAIDRGAGAAASAGDYLEERLDLPAEATAALQELARRHRLTVNTLVQGAWALLLSRYGGERDVVFGATVSGRPAELAGVERMVGMFINTLPVRVRVSPDAVLVNWLREVQERQAETREHEHAPLVDVRAWSELPPGEPLFESLLIFENFPVDPDAAERRGGVELAGFHAFERTNYPLTVMVSVGGSLVLRAGFEADRFDPAAVRRMLGHLRVLLEGMVRAPDARVRDLALLGDGERGRLLAAWSAAGAEAPSGGRVHDRFRAMAARAPEAPALRFRGETLTYAELDRRSEALAARLAGLGVGPEARVGVCLERGPEMVVALLAVLRAGGAYVPVDPAYPAERVAYVLEDSGARVVVTEAGVEGVREDDPAPASAASPDSAAYVIYTSGSTGRPKGVVVPHRAVTAFLDAMRERPGLAADDVLLAVTTLAFDIAGLELWLPLTTGACVALADRATAADGALLRDALAATGATVMQATPATWRMLLEAGWEGAPGFRALCGGEALPRELADRLLPCCGELWNLYGPTETTVWSTVARVEPAGGPVDLGRPIAGTRLLVVDGELEPAPAGVPGELWIGGAGVARGYLGRPDLTAERFVPDPFAVEPGGRLYRTGDVVRWGEDGPLEYLGRTDHQVKVRGFRIELGEVEAALEADARVAEAAVVAREDGSGHLRLVAYLALAAGEEEAGLAEALRDALRARLPEHMVPSALVVLDVFPRTPNGKTDRRALAEREVALPGAAGGFVAPRTPEEEIVARAWAEVLGVERVGARDDFFALGGHSLLAMRVLTRVRTAFGVEMPLQALFDAPRLDAFAERVRAARAGTDAAAPAPIRRLARGRAAPSPPATIPRAPRDRPLPLSFAQERLWFLEQLDPGGAAYVMSGALRLSGPLDAAALERALAEVVARHEALRTVFRTADGVAAQVVLPAEGWTLPVEELSGLPEEAREREAVIEVAEEAQRPFDLERGPLFRASLLRLAADEHVLVLALHHAVGDEWSMSVLVREACAAYAAFARGSEPLLPPLPVQYADYAAWQRERLSGDVLEAQLAFWRERLRGAPRALDLPTDRPRPPVRSHRGALHRFDLPAERLDALGREHGATLFMTLLAAFQLLLARWSGEETVVVGTPVSARPREELEGLVGFFVNTLALRADVAGDATFTSLLAQVRESTLDAFAHSDLPFERLVDEVQPERDRSRTPVFQVAFALQNAPAAAPELPGVRIGAQAGAERATAKFDLTLEAVQEDGVLRASLEYASELFDAATVERMAAHFRALLAAVAADPGARLSTVSFLGDEERAVLAAGGNPRLRRFPVTTTLHRRFAEVARARPDAVAVTSGPESLTYTELDARAERLAEALRGAGVGPETLVGLCVERSLETVVGILGILGAGGAYVPLDPDYPAERLAYLLEDSAVRVLVAQEGIAGRLPEFGGRVVMVEAARPHPAALEPPPSPTGGGGASPSDPAVQSAEAGPEALTPRPPLPMLGEGEHDSVEREDRSVEMPLPRNGGGWRARGEPGGGPQVSPENLAYVIYTSGSTGRPKGVAVTHANVLRLFDATEADFGFGADDVWTLFHSYAFDFSVWEIWGALLHGGRLVVVPWETSRDPEAFRRLLAEERVTVLSQTPSAFRQLVRADAAAGSELALREVVFGGEALEPGSLRPWTERHGVERPRLVNMHGITETTVHDSFRPVAPADVEAGSASPLGRPLPDGRLYVLDAAGELAPTGVPGELCVAGAGVARGYLGRAELTAERFVPDPFSGEAGARMYRSGDRVRRRADGELEYLGRTDFQVKVRGFRIEPGEIEAVLLEHVREAVVMVREDAPGQTRLVAYVVADGPADAAELRARAAERLPDHMVPSAFVLLDALPLTANGKTDRRALPAPGEESVARGELVAPRDAKEAALAAVWRDVLRLERVGVHDNFFELGGDSILSIQVISRAARAGVRLTPRQVFQHQTVAELAAVADTAATAAAEQGEVTGEAPLTPVQRWFFDQELPEPGHWNHAVLLETRRPVAPALLEGAVGALLRHHDALRLRFRRENGEWRQSFAPFDGHVPFERVEGSAGEEAAERAQRSLDLEAGPLLRAVHFDAGPERPGRLLLVVHHLAVDGVSWRILVEDLERAVAQLARGEEPRLPAKTTSFRAWAERLRAHAGLPETRAERDAWLAAAGAGAPPLPADFPDGANTEGLARTVTAALTEEETRALLQEVPAAFRARIDEVLLAALARALGAWTGERSLLVDLEGHGREDLGEDVDLSRTVGWFTSIFPVRLDADPTAPPAETVRAVRERLRALPGKGIGYGVLRWLAGDAGLAAAPEPQVAFNYLGRFDGAEADDALFAAVEGPTGAARSPAAPRRYLLEVNAGVAGGTFRASWTYGSRVHRAATAERLAEAFLGALRELIAAAREGRAAGPVPSDFPLLAVEQAELGRVLAGLPDVEDAYPATPLQQGILFHALRSREGGMYFEQLAVHLLGGLDPEALRRAWQEVADRHAPLRTSFLPRETGEPVQVVRRRVEHPFEAHDWRGVAAGDRAALLEAFLAGDRERGFDPAVAPLSRVALLRAGDEEWHLVWSHHHVLLDGWSVPLVLGEVFALYAAARAGRRVELPAPRPFREYVAWLRGRDAAASEAFWREELRGIEEPTRLPADRGAPAPDAPAAGERELRLGEEEAASLRALARRRRVTPSTLVQGAWALLLSRYTGERDVVFGATVSGRTADLPEMEARVGVFINTLPVRAAVPSDARLGEWLGTLQERQAEMRRFEHTPLVDVQAWSEVPRGTPLFESIVVFENYPAESAALDGTGLRVAGSRMAERSNYPFGLLADPGHGLTLRARYDGRRFADDAAERVLEHVRALLLGMAAAPGARLRDLSLTTAAERERLLSSDAPALAPGTGEVPVHAAIREQARRTPDAVAVASGDASLTYAALDAAAAGLAARLRALGVGPETRVGVCAEPGTGMIAGILGVLYAGGAYVPLDPAYPRERISYLLEDSAVPVLVTEPGLVERMPEFGGEVVSLDTPHPRPLPHKGGGEHDHDTVEGEDRSVDMPLPQHGGGWRARGEPGGGLSPDHLAYVIYTSGSTGRPKGVGVTHRALACSTAARFERYGGAVREFLLLSSISFDSSVAGIFWTLCAGGTLRVAGEAERRDPARLAEIVARHRVSHLLCVPSLHGALLDEAVRRDGMAPEAVILGGEACPPELVARHARLLPGTALFNEYGPTEATVWCTVHECRAEDAEGRVPVGRAIPGARVHVLDREGEPAPAGVPGELYVGGEGVARGYLGRAALTAERFVPDPFSRVPGARMYRTGDLARRGAGGELEYLGRTDHQVKVRGFRVEPGEVEDALLGVPGVREAAVAAREDGPGGARLVAWFAAREGSGLTAEGVRAALAERLPDHLVPSAVVALDALPRTPNGKTDRRALPAPEARAADDGAPPSTPTEEALAAIWREVLGVERVGAGDDFFALGGHSLLAMQVASRVRAEMELDLPVQAVFDHPRLAELAAEIDLMEEALVASLLAEIEALTDGEAGAAYDEERALRPEARQ